MNGIPEEIYAVMGQRLKLIQDLEYIIGFVAKVVFEDDPEKAKNAILSSDKKTLGQLIHFMKTKVDIDCDFDARLKQTLIARNEFIHRFTRTHDLSHQKGLEGGSCFLIDTCKDLGEVLNMMNALVLSFGREHGVENLELENEWRKYGNLGELESKYLEQVSEVFKPKENGKT